VNAVGDEVLKSVARHWTGYNLNMVICCLWHVHRGVRASAGRQYCVSLNVILPRFESRDRDVHTSALEQATNVRPVI